MFAAIMLAMTAQYTCKISTLLFYRRIFLASDLHRDVSLGLMAFASTWLIFAIVALLRICRPLKLVWLPEEQHDGAKCGNWVAMVFSVLLVDVLTDVAILLLPIRTAFTLQMSLRAKIGVASIFALGGFVIVTSALRMELVDPRESTYTKTRGLWRFTDTLQSTSIEQNSGHLFIYVPPSCVLVYPYTSHYGHPSQQR